MLDVEFYVARARATSGDTGPIFLKYREFASDGVDFSDGCEDEIILERLKSEMICYLVMD